MWKTTLKLLVLLSLLTPSVLLAEYPGFQVGLNYDTIFQKCSIHLGIVLPDSPSRFALDFGYMLAGDKATVFDICITGRDIFSTDEAKKNNLNRPFRLSWGIRTGCRIAKYNGIDETFCNFFAGFGVSFISSPVKGMRMFIDCMPLIIFGRYANECGFYCGVGWMVR